MLAAVRALRAGGYEPWVTTSTPKAYAARSRAVAGVIIVPDSGRRPQEFVDAVLAGARRVGAGALIAGTDRHLILLARARAQLGALSAGIPELEQVMRITSKSTVYRLGAEAGLRVPKTVAVASGAWSEVAISGDEVVLKPERSELESSGGEFTRMGARRVSCEEEMQRVAAPPSAWLAQPYIPGQLGAISGVAAEGSMLCAVHQRAERIWPFDGGISAYAQTVNRDRALEDGIAGLIGRLGWSGIFQAQFIHTPDGAYLIDLNPRIYGSISLAIAAGANLPVIWAGILTGSAVRPAGYRVGVRYRNEELDGRAVLRLLRAGSWAAALRGLVPRPRTVHSVMSLTDPLPLLTSVGKLRRLASRR